MIRKAILLCSACLLFSGQASAQILEQLAGNWKFIASPFEGGSEEIEFTATASSDGTGLVCHADKFLVRASQPYAADWKLAVEQNGENIRLGWVLDAENPASSQEYQEPATSYVLGGKNADGDHRYIYLLTENIDTQKLEGMTLWSDWQSAGSTTFSLPKTQQIYAVVSPYKPYNGAVGYAEIWASVKVQKAESAGIAEVNNATQSANAPVYSLQGVRMNQLQRGINIVNGKKVIKK